MEDQHVRDPVVTSEAPVRIHPPQQRVRHVLVAGLRSMAEFEIDDLIRGDTSEDLIRGADTLIPIPIDDARLRFQDDSDSFRRRLA